MKVTKTAPKEVERVYLEEQEFLVTNKRIVFNERTYALEHITAPGASVYKGGPKTIFGINIDKLASWCWLLGIYLGVATTLCWLGLFVFKFLGLIQTNLIISILNLMLNATVLLVIVAVVISIFWIFWSSNMCRVDIRSISGEEIGLHCDSIDEAQTIGKAINDAIFENFALKNTFIRSSWL